MKGDSGHHLGAKISCVCDNTCHLGVRIDKGGGNGCCLDVNVGGRDRVHLGAS